ncbi:MarR family transcriptional regulator [Rhodococcus sp. 05-340-1]|uniref:MarR family winged helix-turn-helix transcriptional regulator n=1 Tax=Nocardiaceae TaxID=85025 RepID=UPI00056A6788|nr:MULTISPECIES: MarR family transcriptional regulator [Rhodococcus]OZD72405.1 MarR family transcriptional regulator [Rhodococcus sp. 05-340-2]OZD76089.1 MarR family transcriptional regulator [Rhodococcus sp. 05-340-1]OZE91356.1 MarR family transcriptional regulator [Rhodococcus sp. 15-2388-1-1a]OZF32596.1 MarR family transcriptional regulator [Rhodococcus sp. 14-2483-1-2]
MSHSDADIRDLLSQLVTSSSRFVRLAARFGSDEWPRAWMRALSLLEEYQPLRISTFAELDRCSQPSATALLAKLSKSGLVTRTADPDDSRAVLIEMTDAGHRWLAASRRHIVDGLVPYLSDRDPEQIQKLTDGLSELRSILEPVDRGMRGTSS